MDNAFSRLNQPDRTRKLSTVLGLSSNLLAFISQRTRGAYIADVGCLDLSFGFAVCSRYVNSDTVSTKRLNMYINKAKNEACFGQSFV